MGSFPLQRSKPAGKCVKYGLQMIFPNLINPNAVTVLKTKFNTA